eukprot:13212259-Alexandrium_andersonii.AAC.1
MAASERHEPRVGRAAVQLQAARRDRAPLRSTTPPPRSPLPSRGRVTERAGKGHCAITSSASSPCLLYTSPSPRD